MAEKKKHGAKPDSGKEVLRVIKPELGKEVVNQPIEVAK